MQGCADPRHEKMSDYPLPVIAWTAIFMFLFKLESARNINYQLNCPTFVANVKAMWPTLGITDTKAYQMARIPDYGSLTYLFARMNPGDWESVQIQAIQRLIRQRALEKYRLLDRYYLMAVDGTRVLTISQETYQKEPEKYQHYLRKKISENPTGQPIYEYYLYVVEAKLVTSNGFAISVMSEFAENESQDVDKQDCELKAFYRLAQRLKAEFPRTEICFLMDSLYAAGPVFEILKQNRWEAVIRFKEGKIPSLAEEFENFRMTDSAYRGQAIPAQDVFQSFVWVNDIEYQGQYALNILECEETKGKKNTRFTWISTLKVHQENFKQISNKGGRLRWKVENEGFNTQKNGGYNLEHAYSENYNALKCYYFLLQFAHMLCQLMEKGNLLKKDIAKAFGSIRNFYRKLQSLFTHFKLDLAEVLARLSQPFQIRLDSS
jgi:hypothetical protein